MADLAVRSPVTVPTPTASGHAASKGYVDSTFQLADTDLTAIAALSPADGSYIQRASGVWVSRTATQTLADLGAVPTARTVAAGTGLTGGGDLSANRTLAVSYGSSSGTAVQGNDTRVTADQAAATASIRTLGTGSAQAAAGDHGHTYGQTATVVARGRRTTVSTGTTATVSTSGQGVLRLTGISLTAGRLYRVAVPNVGMASTTAGNIAGLQLTYTTNNTTPTVSSTILTLGAVNCATANQQYGVHMSCVYAPGSNQTFGVLFSIWRQSGASGTVTAYGNAIWPCDLVIEDLGADPGDTGTSI